MSDSEVTRYVDWGAPSDVNVKAMEMHFMAKSFIRDADSLADSYSAGQFVLFIFGIELALKAFLHERGISLDVLRQTFGHDLSELFQEAEKHGLSISAAQTASVLGRLNEANKRAQLRYDLAFAVPMPQEVSFIAHALLRDTVPQFPKVEPSPVNKASET